MIWPNLDPQIFARIFYERVRKEVVHCPHMKEVTMVLFNDNILTDFFLKWMGIMRNTYKKKGKYY